jgi:hypothetical protein
LPLSRKNIQSTSLGSHESTHNQYGLIQQVMVSAQIMALAGQFSRRWRCPEGANVGKSRPVSAPSRRKAQKSARGMLFYRIRKSACEAQLSLFQHAKKRAEAGD